MRVLSSFQMSVENAAIDGTEPIVKKTAELLTTIKLTKTSASRLAVYY